MVFKISVAFFKKRKKNIFTIHEQTEIIRFKTVYLVPACKENQFIPIRQKSSVL